MASVYIKRDKWYLQFKDEHGRWRNRPSKARTKTEAKRLALEIELRCERLRHGLEVAPAEDGGGTLRELLSWWLATYSKASASHQKNVSTLNANLMESELADLRLAEITAGRIETFLQKRGEAVGPQTINHLRRFIGTAFTRAKQAGKWSGPNPAKEVARRKIPKRLPDFLRAEEVPPVLAEVSDKYRPLFATAIYSAMRRGELLALHKTDIDFRTGLITVGRSHGRDTTKGAATKAVPIADELVPYLKTAIARSPSELVFPNDDGRRMRPDVRLEDILRRALGRAGIVEHYDHVCRHKGCGHSERAKDNGVRRCPVHKHLLWPRAITRRIRFHDLRHTTASLLMMAGANPAAVQRILRHADPRITMEVYGHLSAGYLRSEVNLLRFALPSEAPVAASGASCDGTGEGAPALTDANPFTAPLLPDPPPGSEAPVGPVTEPLENKGDDGARHRGFEPLTYGSGGQILMSAPKCMTVQTAWKAVPRILPRVHRSAPTVQCRTIAVSSAVRPR